MKSRVYRIDMNTVGVDLTANQHTDYGDLIGFLFYSRSSLLEQAPERSGYPHNGGQHTLSIKGKSDDVGAYLDLLIEDFSQPKYTRFIKGVDVLKEIKEEFLQYLKRK